MDRPTEAAPLAAPPAVSHPDTRLGQWWQRVVRAISWTPPTSTEVAIVVKSGLAAGLAWWAARVVTDLSNPVLAALPALVVVQVSVRSSIRTAIQRSLAVVLGVFVALAIGGALGLNGITIAVLVAVSLGIAQLVLRLPDSAARQLPVSVLVVLTTVAGSQQNYARQRVAETVIGAAVGVVVSLVLPASRLVDARQTLDRLATGLRAALEAMGSGLQQAWSTDQTLEWRRMARTVRTRLVGQAAEAAGNGREAARWNVRDRRHIEAIGRCEDVLPRLERTAIGVSVIGRGLDDHAHLSGETHRAMPAMGKLLIALAIAVEAVARQNLDGLDEADVAAALAEVRVRRDGCVKGASRRARMALEHGGGAEGLALEGEWLNYAALLVQVDRIVGDLSAPLPT